MYTRAELIAMLVIGVGIGAALSNKTWTKKYNALVKDYNMVIERDRIKSRVFKEIIPQLPDGYDISEQSLIDIQSWNMFSQNDL